MFTKNVSTIQLFDNQMCQLVLQLAQTRLSHRKGARGFYNEKFQVVKKTDENVDSTPKNKNNSRMLKHDEYLYLQLRRLTVCGYMSYQVWK